jgi:hypothetical protein
LYFLQATQNTRFKNQLKHCKYYVHTGELESYHNVHLIYAPKRIGYSYAGMVLRTILAVLDTNYNVNRAKSGIVKCKYSKATKQYKLVEQPVPKSHKWRKDLVSLTVDFAIGKIDIPYDPKITELLFPHDLPDTIAVVPKPTRDELAQAKKFRL